MHAPRLLEHLLLLAACLLVAGPASADATMEQMQQSSVRIVCKTKTAVSTGTGFVVSAERVTYLVTNYHVAICGTADEAEAVFAFLAPNEGVQLLLEWVDAGQDLALLRSVRPLGRPAVQFADTRLVAVGEPVVVVGFPGAADRVVENEDFTVPTVTRGNISRIVHSDNNGVRYFQHSAATNPGNSGGPVFDEAGNVIGVNSLKALTNGLSLNGGKISSERVSSGEGIALAIDVAEVIPRMKAEGIPYAAASGISASEILLAIVAVVFVGTFGILLAIPSGRTLMSQFVPSARKGGQRTSGTGRIRIVEGSLAGVEVPIAQGIILGRDPTQAQLVFPQDDLAVSRRHCDIRFDSAAGLFEVRDLGSRNGTFIVSDARTHRRLVKDAVEKLAPGQNILVGSPRNRIVLDLS